MVNVSECTVAGSGSGETDLVGEDHETPVGLTAQDTPDALCSVPHRVEAEELGLADTVRVSEVLQPRLQNPALGILIRYAAGKRLWSAGAASDAMGRTQT